MDLTPEPTIRQKRRRALLVISLMVGIPAFVFLLYSQTIGKSPLAGSSSHDFGYVVIEDGAAQVEHTFELRNRTGSPIRLGEPRTSCGCTVSALSTDVVDPGETVSVTAVLTLSRVGRQSSDISIPMEGRGVRTLRVTGVGRPSRELHASQPMIGVPRERESVVTIFAHVWPDAWDDVTDVPMPEIESPAGVSARLTGWSLRQRPERDAAAQWQGQLAVALSDDEPLPDDAEVVLTLREGQTLSLPVVEVSLRQFLSGPDYPGAPRAGREMTPVPMPAAR